MTAEHAPLTEEEIAKATRLCADASAAPWTLNEPVNYIESADVPIIDADDMTEADARFVMGARSILPRALEDLRRAREALQRLAAKEPVVGPYESAEPLCGYCDGMGGTDHREYCPWLAARKFADPAR